MRTVGLLSWLLAATGCKTTDGLRPGDPLPVFRATAHDGSQLTPETLRGQWAVLWFFPKADTPGWTLQAKSLRDGLEDLRSLGAVVVGVSRDRVDQSKSFADKLGLPYLLVADPEGELGAKLGVPSRVGFYARHTVIVSPQGRIVTVLRDVDVKNHADQVASAIRQAMAESGPGS